MCTWLLSLLHVMIYILVLHGDGISCTSWRWHILYFVRYAYLVLRDSCSVHLLVALHPVGEYLLLLLIHLIPLLHGVHSTSFSICIFLSFHHGVICPFLFCSSCYFPTSYSTHVLILYFTEQIYCTASSLPSYSLCTKWSRYILPIQVFN
jgi:hypothetical protein